MRFAFLGRVSTEDAQDPEVSRGWQLRRSRALIEPVGGLIVTEYFDIGQSRSLPWSRRPEASKLLGALKDPDRGFSAVVIGEPQRAFYGNKFSLTFPVFVHYGVALWVPEVGGAVDPGIEAHDSRARHGRRRIGGPEPSPTGQNWPTPRRRWSAKGSSLPTSSGSPAPT